MRFLRYNQHKLSRRGFLKGAIGGSIVTLALPPLELFMGRQALANDGGFPLRFGMFFWGNGNRPDQWTPNTEGSLQTASISPSLQPLQRHSSKLSVITGLENKVNNTSPHWSGAMGFLTGLDPSGTNESWTAAGPTFDQILAQELGDQTVYRSIIAGCKTNKSISWNGPNAQNPVEADPFLFYEKLFGPTFRAPGEEGLIDPSLGYRQSVLDVISADLQALTPRLGSADQQRLEQHLDGIREIETRLARLQEDPPDLEACERPIVPEQEYLDINGRPQMSARNRVMSSMMAMALACDQTRVLSYTYTKPLNNILFPYSSDGHHTLTHNEPGDQPEVQEITRFCMSEAAVFLDALDAIPEGSGTLLDNCGIVLSSEVSEGRTHSTTEHPLLIAGGAGGRLKMGIHYRSYAKENLNSATLSVMRALGSDIASLGEGNTYTSDGLSAIEN